MEIGNDKDLTKSDTEIETFESTEQVKFSLKYEEGRINFLDDLNERETSDPRAQALFNCSRNKKFSTFLFSQDYYELP